MKGQGKAVSYVDNRPPSRRADVEERALVRNFVSRGFQRRAGAVVEEVKLLGLRKQSGWRQRAAIEVAAEVRRTTGVRGLSWDEQRESTLEDKR